MTRDWREEHANAADKALSHPLVEGVMQEYAGNMRFDPKVGLPAYGMLKVAMYAAQVARAQALGIDPDLLRMTGEEQIDQQDELVYLAIELGVPVIFAPGTPQGDDN